MGTQIIPIVIGGKEMPVHILRKHAQIDIRIVIRPDMAIHVITNEFMPVTIVTQFVRAKSSWILRAISKLQSRQSNIVRISRDEYYAKRITFLRVLRKRVEHYNSFYKFAYGKISVKNQSSLWGSCTLHGNLQFNFALSLLSQDLVDYVIVHELCHVCQHNHSEAFWNLVARKIPDYKLLRKKLRTYHIAGNHAD